MATWLFLLLFIAVILVAGGFAARTYMTGETVAGFFSRQRPEPRLSVVEHATVDNRRKLLLVRRDGVEHLIMTGGPVDVVIETGIGAPAPASQPTRNAARADSEASVTATPTFGRAPRPLGQVVNE